MLERVHVTIFKKITFVVIPKRYWGVPEGTVTEEMPMERWQHERFSAGYRHMTRWFGYHMMDFLKECGYRYVLRLDEDSYIHSPVQRDLFKQMRDHGWVYGYRMAAIEPVRYQIPEVVTDYIKKRGIQPTILYEYMVPNSLEGFREVENFEVADLKDRWPCHQHENPGCRKGWSGFGYYNNFFLVDLDFWTRPDVRDFWLFIDRTGGMYLRRWGDLMIHTMIVQLFAQPHQVHKFTEFIYEHATTNSKTGECLFGGMVGGTGIPDRKLLERKLSSFMQNNGARARRVGLSVFCSPSFYFQERP
jgi:alpha 1,2-mannosyltransferase